MGIDAEELHLCFLQLLAVIGLSTLEVKDLRRYVRSAEPVRACVKE